MYRLPFLATLAALFGGAPRDLPILSLEDVEKVHAPRVDVPFYAPRGFSRYAPPGPPRGGAYWRRTPRTEADRLAVEKAERRRRRKAYFRAWQNGDYSTALHALASARGLS